ncbi:MAG TPA: hypothetical protein VFK76_01585 [Gaiellaceae bacterium]|nr:hypothetical protein [Gaiellaceae bacterium]
MSRLAVALLASALVAGAGCGGGSQTAPPPTQPSQTTTSTTRPATTPPSPQSMSWEQAGAFVWHESDVSPEELGQELRANGFGWVAVFVQDGVTEDPVENDWIARFRAASGLAVGGWGALRTEPVREAQLASSLVTRDGLDFFIADAEADYAYSGLDGPSDERFRRSARFVSEFRRLQPALPAAVSSYCRPDQHDLDWNAWSTGGFAFLPQAYVNDLGNAASPKSCVEGAMPFFPSSSVHPTVGMYPGVARSLSAAAYARLLGRAGTVGFSVYLAETRMTPDGWRALGEAMLAQGIATRS